MKKQVSFDSYISLVESAARVSALGIGAMLGHFFKNAQAKRFDADYFSVKTFEATAKSRKARPALLLSGRQRPLFMPDKDSFFTISDSDR
ncbi:MAG: hypothetical protein JXR70_17675 [Spirochaetales bacterium]|nr:hypothetical protein [Spirochaetales bacterium]